MIQALMVLPFFMGSSYGAGIARSYYEGRKIRYLDSSLLKETLPRGIALPLSFLACGIVMQLFPKKEQGEGKSSNLEKEGKGKASNLEKNIVVLTGLSVLIGLNYFSKGGWKIKAAEAGGQLAGCAIVAALISAKKT